ncbi:MAG: FAD-dependent oxidoreductase, partial [Elusimicrobiales bacterium]|nr:FAD-dependent oxidoreductase [Elusimicrobiales bacterium]
PANPEEIEEALEEGVEINFLVAPKKIVSNGDKLNMECIKMKLGEPDASGRRRPVPIEGSDFVLEVDRLVSAIGQKNMICEGFGIELNKWGDISVDEESMNTSRKGVFSGGDVVTGPASVIKAVSAGRKAAVSMDKYLGGKGDIAQNLAVVEEEDVCIGRDENFADRKREHPALLNAKERTKDFSQVEFCFEEKAVVSEAERCLKCQLRLGIGKAPFPPEKH